MTNQDNTDGIAALLQAAGEVHDQMNAPGGRATVEAPTVPSTSDITEQLRRMSETFSAHLTVITGKVDSLAERVDHVERERSPPTATPPPQTPAPGGSENQTPMTSTTPWWQRDPNERLVVDPNEDLTWPDDTEPEEQGCPLHTVSSTTEALLKDACSKTVSNDTRRRWRKQFGMPANDRTKCPKLDTTLKARLPKQCKENDRSLARLQTMVLDAMGPLTHLLELQQRGQLTPEAVTDSASQAIKFVGNASTAISQERRRRAGTFFNEDLKAFIEEQEQAAPLLFGKEFLGIAKTHAESVKALDRMAQKANQRQSRQQSQQFFRAVFGSVGLYQDYETDSGNPAGVRTTSDHLHRRHSRHGRDRVSIERTHNSSNLPAGESGGCYQSPQVRVNPYPGNRIPRIHSQLCKDGAQATGGKDQEDQERSRQSSAISHCFSTYTVPHRRKDECSHTGHPNGPTLLPKPSDGPQRGSAGGSELLFSNNTDRESQRRVRVVERPLHSVERSESDHPQLLPHNRDRCLDKRVGSSVQWSSHRRAMDLSGTNYAHQLPGATSRSPGSKMFCKEQNKPDDPSQNGQRVSTDIHQQARGDNLPTAELPSQRAMAVVYGEEHPPQSATPSRCAEHHSRRRVAGHERPLGLDAVSNNIPSDQPEAGTSGDGPVCQQANPPTPDICPDPMAMTTDAFTMNWAELRAYANPPWNLIGRVLAQTRQQKAELVLVAPVWKAQVWYQVLQEMLVHIPLLIPPKRDLIEATHPESLPDVTPPLAMWVISGCDTKTARFRKGLRNSSWHRGDKNPPRHMTHSLESGQAGAVNGTVIPFHAL